MSKDTKIQWTDHTFNPWIGCTKVSPGCANCYAEKAFTVKMKGIQWGKGQPRHRTSASYWREPVKWNKQPWICDECGTAHAHPSQICMKAGCLCETKHRARVFCASLADWLDEEVPIEYLADLLKLIYETPNLDWQLLTKRPENFNERLTNVLRLWEDTHTEDALWLWLLEWMTGDTVPAHIQIGTTVENQEMADKRIRELQKIPAKVRFLSCEPLLEAVDIFTQAQIGLEANDADVRDAGYRWIDWVIIGGESGPKARPCNVDWIRSLVWKCQASKVPVFVKQMGSYLADGMRRCGHDVKDPKGGDINEWPVDLRIRQFPGGAL